MMSRGPFQPILFLWFCEKGQGPCSPGKSIFQIPELLDRSPVLTDLFFLFTESLKKEMGRPDRFLCEEARKEKGRETAATSISRCWDPVLWQKLNLFSHFPGQTSRSTLLTMCINRYHVYYSGPQTWYISGYNSCSLRNCCQVLFV